MERVVRVIGGLAALGTRVLSAPPLSYIAPGTLKDDALVIDCVGLFLTREVSLMNAVLHLHRVGLPYASQSICRTMLELAARHTWLVHRDDDRIARVTQWYATVWTDEYLRHRAAGIDADRLDEVKSRAICRARRHLGGARADELDGFFASGRPSRELKGHFHPYGRKSLRALMADAYGSEADKWYGEYVLMCSYVHLSPAVTDGVVITEQSDRGITAVDNPNDDDTARDALWASGRWLTQVVDDANTVLDLGLEEEIRQFAEDWKAAWSDRPTDSTRPARP